MLTDEQYFEDEMRSEARDDADARLAEVLLDNGAICYGCGDEICTLKESQGWPKLCEDCIEVHI